MIARSVTCFRNSKTRREPLCSSGDVQSFGGKINDHTTWGKITSRRHPPSGVFEDWARRLNCSVDTVRKMWERGVL
jgi:hypothetical protein